MVLTRSSREWMQALARLRTKVGRLRAASNPDPELLLVSVDEALELTESLRVQCATLQGRIDELERSAMQSNSEMRALLDRLPCAIVQTDCAGHVLEANPAAAGLLGISAAKLRTELLLHFAENRAAFSGIIRTLPRDAMPVRAAARIRPRDRAPYEAALTILRDPRSSDDRWIWVLERISAVQKPARIPRWAEDAPSPSGLCGS